MYIIGCHNNCCYCRLILDFFFQDARNVSIQEYKFQEPKHSVARIPLGWPKNLTLSSNAFIVEAWVTFQGGVKSCVHTSPFLLETFLSIGKFYVFYLSIYLLSWALFPIPWSRSGLWYHSYTSSTQALCIKVKHELTYS